MKKIILSLAAVLAFALTSDAQTRKGTVLLGAGSQLSSQEITDFTITPKVGYFVQDGIAIGALINFQSNNEDKSLYELNSSLSEIGVFARYYVSNNLFAEIALSNKSNSEESYSLVNKFVEGENGVATQQEVSDVVINSSVESMNLNLGLGYTIVWREHFAVEPFMNLVFENGERKEYNETTLEVDSYDLKGTHFNLGVNFSLFF